MPVRNVGYGGVWDGSRQSQYMCGVWGCLRRFQADPVYIFLALMQEVLKKQVK